MPRPVVNLRLGRYGWKSDEDVHDYLLENLRNRLCPSLAWLTGARSGCTVDLQTDKTRPNRIFSPAGDADSDVDLLVRSTGELYELKPLKPGDVSKGLRQIARDVEWLNGDHARNPTSNTGEWHGGGSFKPALFNYKGHDIFVFYGDHPGLAIYSLTAIRSQERGLSKPHGRTRLPKY